MAEVLFIVVGALFCVVVHLDDEDDEGAQGGDEVGDEQGDVAEEGSLHDEEDAAEAHHAECAEGDAFGVACADGDDGLGQIAEYHAYAGDVAYYCGEEFHVMMLFCDSRQSASRLWGREALVVKRWL